MHCTSLVTFTSNGSGSNSVSFRREMIRMAKDLKFPNLCRYACLNENHHTIGVCLSSHRKHVDAKNNFI